MAVKTQREREAYEVYHVGPGTTQKFDTTKQQHNTINTENCKHSSVWALWGRSPRYS